MICLSLFLLSIMMLTATFFITLLSLKDYWFNSKLHMLRGWIWSNWLLIFLFNVVQASVVLLFSKYQKPRFIIFFSRYNFTNNYSIFENTHFESSLLLVLGFSLLLDLFWKNHINSPKKLASKKLEILRCLKILSLLICWLCIGENAE